MDADTGDTSTVSGCGINDEYARTMVGNMKRDIIGLIKLFFFVITHPIGVYRFTRDVARARREVRGNRLRMHE